MDDKAELWPKALPKRQHRVVARMIEQWREGAMIDPDTAARLTGSIAAVAFDSKRLARYCFIVALSCLAIALAAAWADDYLRRFLASFVELPPPVQTVLFGFTAALLFRVGLRRRSKAPERLYSSEALLFLGGVALAAAIGFLAPMLDRAEGHYSILALLASLNYLVLAFWFGSRLIWVFGLLALGSWLGAETGYLSGYGAYFLGMAYPLRFVFLGVLLTAWGTWAWQLVERAAGDPLPPFLGRLFFFTPQTKVVGLLYLFIALWLMSIFGNYGDLELWRGVPQYQLLAWSVVFAFAALGAIHYGLRCDDPVCRGFGLTFLFINLYTRFFEYCWEAVPKAMLFAVLALSLWFLGNRAERIWRLGERSLGPEPERETPPER